MAVATPAGTVANGYCSVAEVAAEMQIPASDQTRTARIAACVNAASRAIDNLAHRRFWHDAAPTARVFWANSYWELLVDDIAIASTVAVRADTTDSGVFDQLWDATPNTGDFVLLPYNGIAYGQDWAYNAIHATGTNLFPIWGRRPRVQITAQWGWPVVPDGIAEACRLWSARLFRRADSPFGVVGINDFGPVRLQSDPDIDELVIPYQQTRGFA